LQVD